MDIISSLGGIGPLSAGTVLVFAVLLVFRGDLVPRKVHEEVKKDRDDWRTACETERKRMDLASAQLAAIVDGQETELKLIRAIQGVTDE